MNFEKHLKSQFLVAIAYIVIGVIALIALVILLISGKLNGKLSGIIGGLTFGFLPLGIGLLLDYYRVKWNPEKWKKEIELKNEERNIFLRNKSGYEAFGIMSFLMLGLWGVNIWVNISSSLVFPVLLGMMSISYFTILTINAKRY
jgi:hypothetical protein